MEEKKVNDIVVKKDGTATINGKDFIEYMKEQTGDDNIRRCGIATQNGMAFMYSIVEN